jgi:hypothetical protein
MHATIRSYSGGEAFVDALVEREDDIRRIISGIEGFRAYYLVRTSDGNAVTISVFDHERGGDESTRTAAEWVRENLADLSVGAPQVTSGEVAVAF